MRCSTLWLLLVLGMFSQQATSAGFSAAFRQATEGVYRFHTEDLVATASQQTYRIWLAVPQQAAPIAGYPVIYFLDGNAVQQDLQAADLLTLPVKPVLVGIGYPTDERFDLVARAYDYTPPYPGELVSVDQLTPERFNGGADLFLAFIREQLQPWVAQKTHIHPQQQTLWGHSYGALLVLYALFTQPDLFQGYVSVDPSLWWRHGMMLDYAAQRLPSTEPRRLLLLKAGRQRLAPPPFRQVTEAQVAARRAVQSLLPATALRDLGERLNQNPLLEARYIELTDHTHGSSLPASLPHALEFALPGSQ